MIQRVIVTSDGSALNPGLQPYKYNGKELDLMHGLNTYDYGARQYDPLLVTWHGVAFETESSSTTNVLNPDDYVKLLIECWEK